MTGDQKQLIDTLQNEKDLLMKEIGRMKGQYKEVNKQIDETAKLVHEKQVRASVCMDVVIVYSLP